MLRIFDHTNDFDVRFQVPAAVGEVMLQRPIRATEKVTCETFIDHCDLLRSGTISIIQFPSCDQRYPHAGEVSGTDARMLNIHILPFTWVVARERNVV